MQEKPPLSLDLVKPCNHFELCLKDAEPTSLFVDSIGRLWNQFELRVDVDPDTRRKQGNSIMVYTTVLVNGEEIEAQQFVDIPVLLHSLNASGSFEIFTCGCGMPRHCGARFHGVKVEHFQGLLVRWTFDRPQYIYSEGEPCDDSLGSGVTSIFDIRLDQITDALRTYSGALRQLLIDHPNDSIDWPIKGQSARHILEALSASTNSAGGIQYAYQASFD